MTDPVTDRRDAPSHRLFAALYDPVNRRAEETILREHRAYLAADLGGRVLDLGAGTGAMLPSFAAADEREPSSEREPSLELHAIEPDPHMRKRAVAKARDRGLDIEIRAAGAEALPYDDDSFDVVVASLVFCTIPDVEAALDEVARVLRPGGEFRFLEHVRDDGWTGRAQDVLTPVWRRAVAGCHLDRDTAATFADDDRFELVDRDEFDLAIPPVNPFVRGTLVRVGDDPARRPRSKARTPDDFRK